MVTREIIEAAAGAAHVPSEQARVLIAAVLARLSDEVAAPGPVAPSPATSPPPVRARPPVPGGPSPAALVATLRAWPASRLRRLEEAMRHHAPLPDSPEALDDDTRDELEIRNLLRVLAQVREVEGRAIPGPHLERRLGVTRQRLQQLRGARQLLGLRLSFHRELFYPAWQFGADGRPSPHLPRLLDAADQARLDPLALDGLMLNPAAGRGRAPADLLRLGQIEQVVALVRAAGEGS
jgi:hypothetical protein